MSFKKEVKYSLCVFGLLAFISIIRQIWLHSQNFILNPIQAVVIFAVYIICLNIWWRGIKNRVVYDSVKSFLTAEEYSFVGRAKAAGCESFWYKEMGEVEFLDIVDRTIAGESIYPESLPSVQIGNADSSDFTERELQIIRELVLGKSYQAIAEDMELSINTIKGHLKNIYAKTGYNKSIQVVVAAVGHRLVLPEF